MTEAQKNEIRENIARIKSDMSATQISLFEDSSSKREKYEKREVAVDKIRQKFGNESIINGAIIDSDIGLYDSKSKKRRE